MNEINGSPVVECAKTYLTRMLELMGVEATLDEQSVDETTVCYRINCQENDAKMLIGRKGTTLEAMQFLLRQMCKGAVGEDEHFIIDVCDYRERRREAILDRAKKASVAVLNGEYEDFSLPPMTAFERRIVHNYLHEHFSDLQSESHGQGEDRHIVISYSGIQEEPTEENS